MTAMGPVGSAPVAAVPSDKKERLQSSIQFPYGDLDTAVEVVTAMHNSGYRDCATDQLAAALNQQVSSGNFRQKVAAARIFALIDTAPGRISITDLGYRVLDPNQRKKALADAFLSVELYKRLYDDFRGQILPPRPAALERRFETYGVSAKQTDKARHAFERSAKQAGFFPNGNMDRLVMPGGLDMPPTPQDAPAGLAVSARFAGGGPSFAGGAQPYGGGGGGSGGGDFPDLDPLIVALLRKLPKTATWPLPERAKWLRALAINLSFVYEADSDDDGEILVALHPGTPAA
ncbi:hypothetical protein [Dongia sedimenti]|uniref:Uncharacterized protein n=1 Tax=Dongia sedimenti TaxID=3064282 RepID=A0ABU0YHH4_9PROT|nr:hypothetical protein [Rhodospirillaceae bacterium R-7]